MQRITKAVITVAGFGTRFLPATKAQPKEMLAIIDKPVIQYIVEEMVASGIKQIILVTSPEKRAVEDYFDHNKDLETHLEKKERFSQLKEINQISEMAYFIYIRQKGPYGNATPIINAQEIIGDEPFVLSFSDDVIKSKVPVTKQMIEVYNKYKGPVVGVAKVKKEDVGNYGIIDPVKITNRVYRVKDIVEKPLVKDAPSQLAVTGRYIFTPDIFKAIKRTEIGKAGELWLSDAVDILLGERKFYACEYEGKYYDCGNKIEFLKAVVDFALERKDLKNDFKNYLKSIIK